jgi:Uncharacterized protein conserved in bacteria
VEQELVLRGVFTFLVGSGFRLSVRDYQDALQALRAGYGLHRRDQLLWLCQTLWARSDDEVRLLTRLFRQFPLPTAAEVAKWTGTDGERAKSEEDQVHDATDASRTHEDEGSRADEIVTVPGVQFTAHGESGLGLPRAMVRLIPSEAFIFTIRPILPLRTLIIIWRRFRLALRTGPKVELDIEATIAERSRTGVLTTPVLVPERCNQARLVVLFDVSDSMVPWEHFRKMLVASLAESQLGQAIVYYFHNVPDQVVYQSDTLTEPLTLSGALKQHPHSTLLIVSDGGAARGRRNRARFRETHQALLAMRRYWQPIAWINPMPKRRWIGSSAEEISRLPYVVMFELTEDGLTSAIDVLRGQRSM